MRAEIIKGITQMKERALNSESSTRTLQADGLELINESSIAGLPKLDSKKGTIRPPKKL